MHIYICLMACGYVRNHKGIKGLVMVTLNKDLKANFWVWREKRKYLMGVYWTRIDFGSFSAINSNHVLHVFTSGCCYASSFWSSYKFSYEIWSQYEFNFINKNIKTESIIAFTQFGSLSTNPWRNKSLYPTLHDGYPCKTHGHGTPSQRLLQKMRG